MISLMDSNDIDLLQYNVSYGEDIRKEYSCFGSEKNYAISFNIAHQIFPYRSYLGVCPKFFEIYNKGSKAGIVVDAQDLEVKIVDGRSLGGAKKLQKAFLKEGLEYDIKYVKNNFS